MVNFIPNHNLRWRVLRDWVSNLCLLRGYNRLRRKKSLYKIGFTSYKEGGCYSGGNLKLTMSSTTRWKWEEWRFRCTRVKWAPGPQVPPMTTIPRIGVEFSCHYILPTNDWCVTLSPPRCIHLSVKNPDKEESKKIALKLEEDSPNRQNQRRRRWILPNSWLVCTDPTMPKHVKLFSCGPVCTMTLPVSPKTKLQDIQWIHPHHPTYQSLYAIWFPTFRQGNFPTQLPPPTLIWSTSPIQQCRKD